MPALAQLRDAFTYSIHIEPDNTPVEGNASAWGDGTGGEGDQQDQRYWDEINQRLSSGDTWAWCVVIITARHPAIPELQGTDVLGGCCYQDEASFKAEGGYYADMCEQAANDLEAQLERIMHVVCLS